ncbi:MAG: hypothetical protein CMG04_03210 [Candidatus Marinimicrobia bacterium]|nr:hypothetical protein [Candidatus Neomarinimicrobiota bacterium]
METKIPPPIVGLIFGILINYTKDIFPNLEIKNDNLLGIFTIIVGLVCILSAINLFKKYKTTITPLNPSSATNLITNGIYKFSRNPMYLGMLLILAGISIMVNPIGGLLLMLIFLTYINKFQIIPEEKAMADLFKDEFLEYKEKVRRWI